jgi:hypothetical protein
MDEDRVRQIIQEELIKFHIRPLPDRIVFERGFQLLDGRSIQLGRTNGTQIGTASDQKLGFYGVTPIAQQAAITAPTGGGTAGVDSPARTAITDIISRIKNAGITK